MKNKKNLDELSQSNTNESEIMSKSYMNNESIGAIKDGEGHTKRNVTKLESEPTHTREKEGDEDIAKDVLKKTNSY